MGNKVLIKRLKAKDVKPPSLEVLLDMSSDRLTPLPSLAEQTETETTENVKINVPLLQVF